MELEARNLKTGLLEMDGISANQISQHHDTLYKGYVSKTNEIWRELATAERGKANATWSHFRELKVELSFALNAVKLHEAYFENLAGAGSVPGEAVKKAFSDPYGSFEAWTEDFKASGMASRGWVVAAYDHTEERVRNYISDTHNTYGIWWATPLLILDVYEHAYFIDYGVKRAPYLNAFMMNIDWGVVNERLKALRLG